MTTSGTCRSHSAATEKMTLPSVSSPLACRSHVRSAWVKAEPTRHWAEACPCRTVRAKDHHKYLWSTTQRLFILVLKHPAAILYILWSTLFIFALVSSSEIRLILQGRRSRAVIFGLGKIRNRVDGFPSVQAHTAAAAANFRIQPNTLFHRIRSGFQLGPVKHSKKKYNCKRLSQWLQRVFQLQGSRERERGKKKNIWKSERKIALSKTWKSHSWQTFPGKQKPCCFMKIKSAIV